MDEIENNYGSDFGVFRGSWYSNSGNPKRFKCSEDQATKIVSLGLNAMFIEVLHHKLGKLAIDDLTVFNEVTNGR